jgi:hypothetical protein
VKNCSLIFLLIDTERVQLKGNPLTRVLVATFLLIQNVYNLIGNPSYEIYCDTDNNNLINPDGLPGAASTTGLAPTDIGLYRT